MTERACTSGICVINDLRQPPAASKQMSATPSDRGTRPGFDGCPDRGIRAHKQLPLFLHSPMADKNQHCSSIDCVVLRDPTESEDYVAPACIVDANPVEDKKIRMLVIECAELLMAQRKTRDSTVESRPAFPTAPAAPTTSAATVPPPATDLP